MAAATEIVVKLRLDATDFIAALERIAAAAREEEDVD